MSNMQQSFSAGQTQGQTQANVEDWMQSGQNTGNAARDRTASAAQSAGDSAKQGTDQASGFLQQTGEQVKSMAQGAVDAVKNTLGTGDSSTTIPTTNRKS